MWVRLGKGTYPKEEGRYKCLVEQDEFGTLLEVDNEYFNGKDWCHYESHRQFISYWWSDNFDFEDEK